MIVAVTATEGALASWAPGGLLREELRQSSTPRGVLPSPRFPKEEAEPGKSRGDDGGTEIGSQNSVQTIFVCVFLCWG